ARRVDPPLGFRHRNPLDAMRPAFPLEGRIRALALDRKADALEAARRVGARLELLPLEPAPLGVAGQHAEEAARPERRLVAAGRLADLDDHVLAVGWIGLDERELQLVFEVRKLSRPRAREITRPGRLSTTCNASHGDASSRPRQ